MKKLYCFDFDGTLTTKDTMFLFFKFYNARKFRIQFLKYIPLFIFMKLKLLNVEKVKKSFVASILKGESRGNLEKKAQLFFEAFYPDIIRPNANDFLQKIDTENTDMIMVTASLDIWTKPFAEHWNMKLLATKAKYTNDVFTGKFETPNCNGKEKIVRIKTEIKDKKYDKIIAFGDTMGDRPMLEWANEGHYRFFH